LTTSLWFEAYSLQYSIQTSFLNWKSGIWVFDPARVVPGHFGRDWAAEIGNRDVRMKAKHVKTTTPTEAVS